MMFLDNRYTRWYRGVVSEAQARPVPDEYLERHHIVPRSMGGGDGPDNIVALTLREHFVCHLLLLKMVKSTKHKRSMGFAFRFMSTRRNGETSGNSLLYRLYKSKWRELGYSAETRAKLSKIKLGKKFGPLTKKHRAKVSKALTGKKRAPFTDEHKANIRKARARQNTPEYKEHMRRVNTGRKQTPEAIEKTRRANLGRKHTPERIEKMRGSKHTPETIEKMRQAHLGIKHTPETIEKLRQATLKQHARRKAEAK